MIDFVTNYDDPTKANYKVIKKTLSYRTIDKKLISERAVRKNLLVYLRKNPDLPLFVMTHGRSEKFIGNDNSYAITDSDLELFRNRTVFIFACYTANVLGKKAPKFNCIYWGYTGPMSAEFDDLRIISIFEHIFKLILLSYPNLRTIKEIQGFLKKIKQYCDDGALMLDEVHEHDQTFDSIGCYASLIEIWSRLRVYYPNKRKPIIHPEAPLGDLFENF